MSRAMGEEEAVDPDAIARQVRERAEQTNRQQVAAAAERLDGDHHDVLETLCQTVSERVLAGPLAALEVAEECEDAELASAVATLFDIEPSGETPDTIDSDTPETAPLVEH